MILVTAGIVKAHLAWWICSLGIWKVAGGYGQKNSLPYHVELSARLFMCPHNVATIQERDHGGKCSVFYDLASGVTRCHFCCIPLDPRPTVIQFGRVLSKGIITRKQEWLGTFQRFATQFTLWPFNDAHPSKM